MEIRYGANKSDAAGYSTERLRDEFLIENMYRPDEVAAVYSHADRVVVLGIMPVNESVPIDRGMDAGKMFGTKYFLERREAGIFNIGGSGSIVAGGRKYSMEFQDCLYVSKGTEDVIFASDNASEPAKFYAVSAPAHHAYETTHIPIKSSVKKALGSAENSNSRVIHQFIHPDVLKTCQLCMGLTVMDSGNVWNTMPCHTHERRMEVYTYFGMSDGGAVFHFMGEASQTRHLVVQNEQAVISPSWSIHAGCGTADYRFIWAMAGENMEFQDMDAIGNTDLR